MFLFLFLCSVYGKTMENLRRHVDIRLVNNVDRLRKLVAMPSYQRYSIFSEDLAALQMQKVELTLNKPIYVGFTILDVSKLLMYQFHYDYIRPKYGDKAWLLFTDTDSLCYLIETEDVYADMAQDAQHFDFSDYPSDHPLFSTQNKKVIGKMKDETNGKPPVEFVGLRSKMYSLLTDPEIMGKVRAKKTAKGIKQYVVQKHLTHENYRSTLFEKKAEPVSMNMLRSEKHQIYTTTINKVGLSAFDDKRYLLEDGYTSLAYGHYAISQ